MHPTTPRTIELEGVRVHNLQNVSLKLPLDRLIVFSGVSGSGKSSLAFDTLYAEGQRRYIETFSAYARQFLNPLEKPDADRIGNLPPAIAIRQSSVNLSSKSTVATATEVHDYLRLLFAKLGRIVCPGCGVEIRRDDPDSVLALLKRFPDGTRFQVCFPLALTSEDRTGLERLLAEGFTRFVAGGRSLTLSELRASDAADVLVVVDRLSVGKATEERLLDSVELAFREGEERCIVLVEQPAGETPSETLGVDGRDWGVHRFSSRLACEACGREFVAPEPRLFSFNAPLGACPECEGFGAVPAISFEHLVPDPSKTLREGAIAPWTTPAYRHELEELLALAGDYGIPVDVPFRELRPEHLRLITDGVPERDFGGLKGFFRWLERHKYKLSVRVFLNRWRSYETCPVCRGDRLQEQALAVRLVPRQPCGDGWGATGSASVVQSIVLPSRTGTASGTHRSKTDGAVAGRNIAEVCRSNILDARTFFEQLQTTLSEAERTLARTILPEIQSRLEYLSGVGLDYLTLDRTVRTLSGGEAQRVALTAALGSSLVNTLYVLDEPSAGLHPRDSRRVIEAITRLRDAGNTVVVVEHEVDFIRAADHVVDIGPGAGRNGGRIVFEGTPAELERSSESLTGSYLSGRSTVGVSAPGDRRKPNGRVLRLEGAREHNLKNVGVEFPLGVLCVVTGVSGSGKSTLVCDTLYPALARELRQPGPLPRCGEFERLSGAEHVDEVTLVDQQPIGRTPRSNPVTYLKAFDDIRAVFAQSPEAKVRNYSAAEFSFNAAGGGRCPRCRGHGLIEIDMQFLADVSMTCPDCRGARYRREVLEVKHRGMSIADVLDMTAAEAFSFFRGKRRLQRRLQHLKHVGLDYLPLGQPATTLSGGESQRLKLAARLASSSQSRTLFLLDEPTTGLHAADVARLLECLNKLLAVGHSLVVIEHHLDVIRAADWVIDLGPDGGAAGGQIVGCGTPEAIAGLEGSVTGEFLRSVL